MSVIEALESTQTLDGSTLIEEAVRLGFVTEERFNQVVRPENMIGPT